MIVHLRDPIKELRNFGFVMAAILAGVFGLLLPWWKGNGYNLWFLGLATAFVGFALLAPALLNPVFRVWMRIGAVLGWINTRILLGLVFFVIVAPMALFLRLRGWDAMRRGWREKKETYRVTGDYDNDVASTMERPF